MGMIDMVANVRAKFNYDRLRIGKALGNWKSDNNKNNNKNKNSDRSAWGPFPGPKKKHKISHQTESPKFMNANLKPIKRHLQLTGNEKCILWYTEAAHNFFFWTRKRVTNGYERCCCCCCCCRSCCCCRGSCCYQIFDSLRLCRFSTDRNETFHTY